MVRVAAEAIPRSAGVRPVHARLLALAGARPRDPMVEEEQAERRQEEENHGIARKPVAEAFPDGRLEVLLHRQRPNVSFGRADPDPPRSRDGGRARDANLGKGVNTNTPVIKPQNSFARGERKREPCAQSWKRTKMRTSKAPAGRASARVTQTERGAIQAIRLMSAAYGMSVFTSCQMLRRSRGSMYLAITSFQIGISAFQMRKSSETSSKWLSLSPGGQ